jgi:hypothetical protein
MSVKVAKFILTPGQSERRFLWKIPVPKKTAPAKEKQTYADLCERMGGDKILFRSAADNTAKKLPVAFSTNDIVVATYLRRAIKDGRLKAREDITLLPLRCQYCTGDDVFRLPSSTAADHQKMYEHVADAHPEVLTGMLGDEETAA